MITNDTITTILNQLYKYSNTFLNIRNDITLPVPGFSTIEKDLYGRLIPTIIINLSLIPNDENVLAHILSHEWGHHVSKHLLPIKDDTREYIGYDHNRQQKENEADLFAAKFITHYKYNKSAIIDFFKSHPVDIQNRINILTNLSI